MTKSINELLNEHGLSEYAAQILPHVRPALYLTLSEAGEGLGRTRIGGSPDLPPDFIWPTDENSNPMTFAMQINLADVPPFLANPFPAAGLLSVFVSADVFFSNRPMRVYLFPNLSACQRREQCLAIVNPFFSNIEVQRLDTVLGEDLPMWDSDECFAVLDQLLKTMPNADRTALWTTYNDFAASLVPQNTVAKLLGYVPEVDRDPRKDAYVERDVPPELLDKYVDWQTLIIKEATRWLNFLSIYKSSEAKSYADDAIYLESIIKDNDLEKLDFRNIYSVDDGILKNTNPNHSKGETP